MKRISMAIAAIFTICAAFPVVASESLEITWVDLLPEERPYHDPFAELDYEQIGDLAELYRLEVQDQGDVDDAPDSEALEIRARLKAQGLDADWLFEQREIVINQRTRAATEPNPELLGKAVRMPGYLLPLELVGEKAVEFLLVPTVGACIHTPPPPANQMVLVRYPEGFAVDGLYNPVWISGEMRAQRETQLLQLRDGQTNVESTYLVDASSVEAYN